MTRLISEHSVDPGQTAPKMVSLYCLPFPLIFGAFLCCTATLLKVNVDYSILSLMKF